MVYEAFYMSAPKKTLTNRQQCINIGKNGAMRKVTFGVPQGSVFSSLLFLEYKNELPETAIIFSLYYL